MDKGDKTMKARVKATGEIVEVIAIDGDWLFCSDGVHYGVESLEGIESEIDYWTRLEHTYVGMFMKSFLDNFDGTTSMEILADDAIKLAHALVEKMKEE